jgi:hypothetical protein
MNIEDNKPRLAVVIASCVGSPFIDRCLKSLEPQVVGSDIECIVVDRAGESVASAIESQFPWVTVIRRMPGESVPDLRRAGVVAANSHYVAIIEEHCRARKDWVATILRSTEEPIGALGGIVEDANYSRLTDWAVYFTEYNSYMPPIDGSEGTDICAANCVYDRKLLLEHLPPEGSGYWEAGLNSKLLEAGATLRVEPELVVYHTGPFGLSYYLHQRYLFSRAFAGTRRESVSAAFRAVYLLLAPVLIPLLWFRTASRVIKKRQHVGKFFSVTPHMIPITATYVFGEWIGFLLGRGDSLSKIE